MTQDRYALAFDRIKYYLKEGDCYQINLTQRFSSLCTGNPWEAYQALRKINAAPFSAYLNLPEVQILSSSPERFLKVHHRIVETKPIKGTRRRKADALENDKQIQDLKNSDKDRAENVMIVDLLRNDISKSCEEGSVRVPKLFDIETYTTVHHLVSTVTGVLAKTKHALDLLRSCFPGGSITGAPKIRAMEIIEELEPHRRGIYCGSIGYIGFDGNMDTNIAIRTLVHSNGTIRFWAGGGIVNDSVMQDEYQESFDKAAALLQLLNQFLNK
jgi:para-aminobenzoate synthetase component 1